MKLSKFEARNFKPIQASGDLSLDDLNIFIGKNDAGKSSYLEAAHLFLDCDKPSLDQFHKNTENDIEFIGKFKQIPCKLRDALSENHDPDRETFVIKRVFEKNGSSTPSADTYINGEKVVKGTITIDDNELYMAKSRDYVWENFVPEPVPIFAERDVSEQTKLKGGTFLNKLLIPVLKDSGVAESPEVREQVQELQTTLDEMAEGIDRQLTDHMESHMDDVEDISLIPGKVDLGKAITPRIKLKDQHLANSIDIAERGSGVGSLLLLSMMQTYVDMQVGDGYCLLFEEPGNFLHPGAERKMLDALRTIAAEGGQVLVTTHSQVFVDNRDSASLYVTKRTDGRTNFRRVNEDAFVAVDEIGARNSDLLQSDFVIYTEGPSDAKILRTIAKHTIDNWGEYNISIQYLGGSNIAHCDPTELRKINRNFAIILDSEKKSEGAEVDASAKELQEETEALGKECKILEKRAIENYLSEPGINEAFNLTVSDGFVTPYDNMKKKIEQRIATERIDDPDTQRARGAYSKVKHGKQIIEWMCENDESITELEEFINSCVRSCERSY
ncbi:ATP-dependent endonuclease of the OLD family- like protein [Haloferax sp. BAB-2207]|uniref:AAA family ATPase n=1 Tax=Haloferax sp. Atlit-48N TaxID=2077198 RepID=A0ACD5I025_9EURY|nr:AAA family ATPase [Haloferax sp. Atlit-48N]ELK49722.1 ATP-dependent endonuclease of the OLD family- like protein [Haloferax sp. BAB-2207]